VLTQLYNFKATLFIGKMPPAEQTGNQTFDSTLSFPETKIKKLTSPYPFWEVVKLFWRNIAGPSHTNPLRMQYPPNPLVVNADVLPEFQLGIIGDIMDMETFRLQIDASVTEFFRPCRYLLGNFEAVITDQHKTGIVQQSHHPEIMEALAELFSPDKTYLSVANNHSGDFGFQAFKKSTDMMEARGFHMFGWKGVPFCDLTPEIRLLAGSMWSNQACAYVMYLKDVPAHRKPNAFNLLCAHWGYELELFPRSKVVKYGQRLLRDYDAIVGTHAHCPQPFRVDKQNTGNKLVAYSLGDFCIGVKYAMYQYGVIMKITLGPNQNGKCQIGQVEWAYTQVTPKPDGVCIVQIVPKVQL
jgi:hypothetical protein